MKNYPFHRHEGFYKVRYSNYWIVAEWANNEWTVCHNSATYCDKEFDEIDESPIIITENLSIPPS